MLSLVQQRDEVARKCFSCNRRMENGEPFSSSWNTVDVLRTTAKITCSRCDASGKTWGIVKNAMRRHKVNWSLRVVEAKDNRSVISCEIKEKKSPKYRKELIFTFKNGIMMDYEIICEKTGASPYKLAVASTVDLSKKDIRITDALETFPIEEFTVNDNGDVSMPVGENKFNCHCKVTFAHKQILEQYYAYRRENVDHIALAIVENKMMQVTRTNIDFTFTHNTSKEFFMKGVTWMNFDIRKWWRKDKTLFSLPDKAEGGRRPIPEENSRDEVLLICRRSFN